jgi:hypothetical protein
MQQRIRLNIILILGLPAWLFSGCGDGPANDAATVCECFENADGDYKKMERCEAKIDTYREKYRKSEGAMDKFWVAFDECDIHRNASKRKTRRKYEFVKNDYRKPPSKSVGEVIEDRKLTWRDFKGRPERQYDEYVAVVYYDVFYDYVYQKKHRKVNIDFSVWCEFGDKSWSRRYLKYDDDGDYILAHEQGHYDMGRLCAMELRKHFSEFNFDADRYKTQIDSIYDVTWNKYEKLNEQYDNETDHSLEEDEQERWSNTIDSMFIDLKKYAPKREAI